MQVKQVLIISTLVAFVAFVVSCETAIGEKLITQNAQNMQKFNMEQGFKDNASYFYKITRGQVDKVINILTTTVKDHIKPEAKENDTIATLENKKAKLEKQEKEIEDRLEELKDRIKKIKEMIAEKEANVRLAVETVEKEAEEKKEEIKEEQKEEIKEIPEEQEPKIEEPPKEEKPVEEDPKPKEPEVEDPKEPEKPKEPQI